MPWKPMVIDAKKLYDQLIKDEVQAGHGADKAHCHRNFAMPGQNQGVGEQEASINRLVPS